VASPATIAQAIRPREEMCLLICSPSYGPCLQSLIGSD
jgi:hypothetical protein